MGVFQTYRTAAGEGGMRQFLEHFGPCLSLPWTKLMDVPEFNNELIDLISNQSDTQANGLSVTELEQIRDKNLVEIQKVITRVSKLANKSDISRDVLSTRDYVNTKLFEKDCEFKVFEFIGELEKLFSEGYCNYLELLNLFEINVNTIEDLFDNEKGVLIMSEDLKIRNNRLNLLSLIRNYSLKIADFTLLNS